MSDELEVQIINSPYLTLELNSQALRDILGDAIRDEVQSYFEGVDWWDIISDHSREIVDMVHEDMDIHDEVHDIVNQMDFIRDDDLGEEINSNVRQLLRDFVRVENVCSTGDAFIEAVQKVANVSKVDMRQELANQFKNAVIRLDFQTGNERG
jgi:predicted RecB family endonuclease